MIKVIAIDIDGTLVNSQKDITARTKKAINEAKSRGMEIIIASGRPYCGAERYARELKLNEDGGYLLCYNGGQIVDLRTNEVVFDSCIDDSVKYELCRIIKSYDDAIVMTYRGNMLLTENAADEGVIRGAMLNNLTLCEVEDLSSNLDFKVGKFLMQGKPDYIASIAEQVQRSVGSLATVCRSEGVFLEIMPYGVDKGNSLKEFIEKQGYDMSEVMAFGDNYNDTTMLMYSGMGVAMGNANADVKAVADYVTLTNDEDGVADAIEKFVLKY
jgi:hypothetical protein